MSRSSSSDLTPGVAYWVIVVSLLGLGAVSIFSIGSAFWLMAVAMTVLSPFRSRPRVWWSGMAMVAGYLIGYAAIAPWGCSQMGTIDPTTGETEVASVFCRTLIPWITYTGPDGFEPSSTPAVFAGVLVGVVAASVVWIRIGAHQRMADRASLSPGSSDPARRPDRGR